jgi:5-formyltetrahydrofolate cyclo-ligase
MTRGFIPAGEFDVPVDGAVTADGFTWFAEGGEPAGV